MEDQPLLLAIALPAALAVIMVGLGLGLVPADFRRVFSRPKGIGVGLVNLVLISPVLAFAIAELLDLSPVLAAGLVLLGATPGGTMANMLTHLARGDVALSVSMTALSSIAAVITVPLFLTLAVDRFGADLGTDVEMLPVVGRVFLISIVPLMIGMWVRAKAPDWTERNYERFRKAALGAFVLVVVGAVVSENEKVRESFTDVAVATLALNVIAMTLSFFVAKVVRLGDRQATSIAMELGIHNATLAIAVGSAIATELVIPAAVYSAFMFVTGGLFARVMNQRNASSDSHMNSTPSREAPAST